MEESSVIEVVCPTCQTVMTVDAGNGNVLLHKQEKPRGPVADIQEAVQAIKGDSVRRKDMFQKSFEAEKNKSERLKKTFDEAVRRAKENPDELPPQREIDLD